MEDALTITRQPDAVAQDTGPANAGIRLEQVSAAYWKIVLDNPPLNIVGPSQVMALQAIVGDLEANRDLKVVVIESAVPAAFMAHYDLKQPLEASTGLPSGPTGMHPVPDLMVRLARLPAISIVSIRGRASGIGSELALAADLRFASREKGIISQFEVGAGFIPGGGPMARLPRLVGRGRALEILIAADDFDADLAERYGYINRAIPDAELDEFVDRMARRIAGFEQEAIVGTKRLVDLASMPPDEEMQPGWDAFIDSVQKPGAQRRLGALVAKGLQTPGPIEENLGRETALLQFDNAP